MNKAPAQKRSLPEMSEDEVDQIKSAQRRVQNEQWEQMSPEERTKLIQSHFPATDSKPEELFTGMEM